MNDDHLRRRPGSGAGNHRLSGVHSAGAAMTRDQAFAQGFRLAWRWCPVTALIAACLLLSGCYEPASTWSDKQGRYRPTDEVRREIINEEIDKREMERGR